MVLNRKFVPATRLEYEVRVVWEWGGLGHNAHEYEGAL